jgi:eukaryotic-like serine/threonine-protein kinase
MSQAERDLLLAELLDRLESQARQGMTPEVEVLAARHPELAVELRSLWGMARFAGDFAGAALAERTGGEFHPSTRGHDPSVQRAFQRPLATVGCYDLLEKIGEGGMGVVYAARHQSLHRVVALKMIQRGALASGTDVARFRAEAAAAAQLEHPHIVPVYEVGEHEGQPFFSMKLIAGTTLARRLAEGPLAPREAAELLLPVCEAVSHAHEQGIVHRDLKPSNILIDTTGKPHVSDFGLAKRMTVGHGEGAVDARSGASFAPTGVFPEPVTRTGAILGTPSFMSPEQAAGGRGDVGPSTDVYALGAILYHCLTGRPPFQAANPVDVVLMVLEQEPVPPRLLDPRVDPDLEMVALKCLQKPIELRYRTAADLARDLTAYLANEPVSARSTRITQLVSRVLRETHHAGVLENWGVLWMWHSLVLLVLCVVTNVFQYLKIADRLPYLALWILGMGTWAAVFWSLRRRAGPITFVERQIAHVWGASMVASSLLFAVETLLQMPVLQLSPVLPLIGAIVFAIKAGILSGAFYVQAIALFGTAIVMAWMRRPNQADLGLTLYGVVSAIAFLVPGWKYYRQRRRLESGR